MTVTHGLRPHRFAPARLLSVASLCLGVISSSVAKPLKAKLEFSTNLAPAAVFIFKISSAGYVCSPSESGKPEALYPPSAIKEIRFDDPPGWTEAVQAWRAGQWTTAVALLKPLAADYADLTAHRGSPGALAQFYLQEALRQSGQFEALAAELAKPSSNVMILDEASAAQAALHRLWALASKKDWPAIKSILFKDYEVLNPKALAAVPAFKPAPARIHAQLSWLRGAVYESEGKPSEALNEFYRAFSLETGSDQELRRRALDSAIALVEKSGESGPAQKELSALRKLREMSFGKSPKEEPKK